jgi:hypothetical protein
MRCMRCASQAGATPQDKLNAVTRAEVQGRRVVMIGDGINDGQFDDLEREGPRSLERRSTPPLMSIKAHERACRKNLSIGQPVEAREQNMGSAAVVGPAMRRKTRSPQEDERSFTAQPPHLHRLALGHESFAVITCLHALAGAVSETVRGPRLMVDA